MKNNENIKILLVEDNAGDARLAEEYLKEKKFKPENITHVESFEEAKSKLWETSFNVILLDLSLPDSERAETVRSLFNVVEDIPVIILSGSRDDMSTRDSFKFGVQEFLLKDDISSNALSRCINNAILRSEKENELRKLNDFKSNLLSVLSHDLRSPFNALVGYIDFTLEELEEMSKNEIALNLLEIKGISFTLLHFIDNLLSWSRLQGRTQKVELETFSLEDLKQKSKKVLEVNASSKNIELLYDGFNQTMVTADIDMIDSVIRNLVSNAIKFSQENSKIEITAEVNESVKISVKDYGVGIEPECLKDIFVVGRKKVRPGTRNEKGHGLGLQICKDFVEKNGGEIRIESILNKETTVIFSIPLAN